MDSGCGAAGPELASSGARHDCRRCERPRARTRERGSRVPPRFDDEVHHLLDLLSGSLRALLGLPELEVHQTARQQPDHAVLADDLFAFVVLHSDERYRRQPGRCKGGVVSLVAGVYFLIAILWKLPDPYWLITLANFVPLLYPVNLIDEINRARGVRGAWYSRVKVRHVFSCLAGTLALALAMLGMFGPGTQVVRGEHVPERHVAWLRAMGVVKPDEAIEYFYSTAFFSRRSNGYVVTDKGVAVYAKSDGRLNVQSAAYPEIDDINVTFSDSWIDDTAVFIEVRDTDGFYLLLSTEQKLDRTCIRRLMELWQRSKPSASEETATF